MKTRYNGQYVVIEKGDEMETVYSLKCVCGCALLEHDHWYISNSFIETGGCKNSHRKQECLRFRITRDSRIVSYAQT